MNVADFPAVALADAVANLSGTPLVLTQAMALLPEAQWRAPPRPGQFSLVEHACHLRDVERDAYLVRVRRVLSEDMPTLEGFDGTAVAAARDYPAQDAREALADFTAARRELVAMIAPLAPGELAREAMFAGSPKCLADLIAMMLGHDREHIAEIQSLLSVIG
jgi:hypothetical protein